MITPIFILNAMLTNSRHENELSDSGTLKFQLALSYFQALSVFYLTFVSFHESWSCLEGIWLLVGPVIHAILTIATFIVIPLTVIISVYISEDDW